MSRARASGLWAGIASLALPAGPLVGGALVDGLGRRSVFLVNVPIVLVALVWSVVAVRESRDSRAPLPDLPGMSLGALLLFAATYAFIQGGRSGADAPQGLAVAAVAVVALLALGAAEVRRGDTAGRSAGRARGGRAACQAPMTEAPMTEGGPFTGRPGVTLPFLVSDFSARSGPLRTRNRPGDCDGALSRTSFQTEGVPHMCRQRRACLPHPSLAAYPSYRGPITQSAEPGKNQEPADHTGHTGPCPLLSPTGHTTG
ncbi:hypothetical protein [Streptomyces mexicanus]|uniref:hypothetical protein n=1 Tax=Streptomyces mexicanus TaxID=178566 RepID=UPI003649ACD6